MFQGPADPKCGQPDPSEKWKGPKRLCTQPKPHSPTPAPPGAPIWGQSCLLELQRGSEKHITQRMTFPFLSLLWSNWPVQPAFSETQTTKTLLFIPASGPPFRPWCYGTSTQKAVPKGRPSTMGLKSDTPAPTPHPQPQFSANLTLPILLNPKMPSPSPNRQRLQQILFMLCGKRH